VRPPENNDRQVAELYREAILAHAVHPQGHNRSLNVTHRATRNNPLCGDHIEVYLQLEDDLVVEIGFTGEACAICLASASLLCGHIPGMPAAVLSEALTGFSQGLDEAGLPVDAGHPCPEYLAPMLGVRAFPARIACATLPWETAIAALEHPVLQDAS